MPILVAAVEDNPNLPAGMSYRLRASPSYNVVGEYSHAEGLLDEGADHEQIAEKLCRSPDTMRAHLRNTYDKLHVHSKSQAVAKALQERLLPRK